MISFSSLFKKGAGDMKCEKCNIYMNYQEEQDKYECPYCLNVVDAPVIENPI